MKLEYNAPVILTFTLVATAVMVVDSVFGGVTTSLFAFRGVFDFTAPWTTSDSSPTRWATRTGHT